MTSPAQAAANRANAQLSTGPRTPEGKNAASQNARKHGLSSKFLPLSEEEIPHFEELEASLRAGINPQGALQESLFRELAAAAWKRDVVCRLLAEAANSTEALFDDEPSDRVRKLLRHKADQDRAFNRALRQIRELQTTTLLRAVTLASEAAMDLGLTPDTCPGLAAFAKFTKQTQSVLTNPAIPLTKEGPSAPHQQAA